MDYMVKYREIAMSKPRMIYHKGTFPDRAAARNWCRNHSWHADLTIVHPDGRRERYVTFADAP